MKVLFITNIPAPYRIDFYNELGKYVNLTVIFEAKGADGIRFNWNIEEIKNFKAIFLSEGNIKEKRIDWKILKYIKGNKYDHIVATSYSYFTEMIALIYMKLRRIPYYLETDGGIIRKENFFKRGYKKFLISNAKGYFSPSKKSDDYLEFYGAKRKVIYRYPFTSLKRINILSDIPSKEEKLALRSKLEIENKKVVLSVGQFIHRKGYDILLKACQELDNEIDIYIIGGKPTKEYIDLKDKLKLNNVHFIEFKAKDELEEYYKAADLFVLPTREDIWGLVINEAMSKGLPVITTMRCVAGLELVENNYNGFLVEIEDYKDLHNKIKNILNNESIEELSYNSLNKIQEFTIENMCKAHLEVFKGQK